MSKRACVVLAILLICAATGVADRIELHNGDVITGTIVHMDADVIRVRTDYGTLEIDRAAVVSGQFGNARSVEASSLVFEFLLNGNIYDTAGGYQLVNNGMRFVPDATGLPDSALQSDGSGTYLSIAPADALNTLDRFTLSMDVRIDSATRTQYLASKWTAADGESADGKFTLQYASGTLTLYLVGPDGAYSYVSARSALGVGAWSHVAVTFAGGRAAIYVNGEAAGARDLGFSTLLSEQAPLLFMTAQSATGDQYGRYNAVGSVDNIRLYDRALTVDEIALLGE